ncbi:MAG: heavy-metal-associated domain-containing protein, partial [Eggerthellaceae bacterium]|nr:heavy-metal-associated domain-containing protein [Eggerthellaceae bacterium]
HCNNCVSTVDSHYRNLNGVKDIKVNLETQSAVVTYNPELVNTQDLLHALDDTNFQVELEPDSLLADEKDSSRNHSETVELSIDGMHCKNCVATVTERLKGVAGVRDVSVSLEDSSAAVTYDPGIACVEDMIASLEDTSFTAKLKNSGEKELCSADLSIATMHCEKCVNTVRTHYLALDGIESIDIDLEGQAARVVYDPDLVSETDLLHALDDTNFQVNIAPSGLSDDKAAYVTTILEVSTMHCEKCVSTVRTHYEAIEGIKDVDVAL